MSGFFEANLRSLDNESLKEILKKTTPQENIRVLLSKSGSPVPALHENDHDNCYHSRFDPIREGYKLFNSRKPGGIKIFLGLGGAYQISPFLADSKILIIESSHKHLRALLELMDFTPLLSSGRVRILCSPGEGEIARWLKENYIPLLDGALEMIPLRPQIRFDQTCFDLYAGEIETALGQIASDSSTQKKMGRLWQRNIIANFNKALSCPMGLPLTGTHTEAVITAAGPSLYRHREYLKHLPSHVLLMTVDTALPVLRAWEISPEFVVTMDPQFIGYLHFMSPLPAGCTILADMGCSLPESLSPVNWFASPHPLVNYLVGNSSPLITLRGGAGNVTQAGLEILVRSGFNKITLLGADFSYPRAKPYEQDSYFYPWFSVRSGRTAPLENYLTGFVLKQKGLRKDGSLYRTGRLDKYRDDLINFIHNCQGRIDKRSSGEWKIELPLAEIKEKKEINSGRSDILHLYKENLSKLRFLNNRPEWVTLLPLAYSFYEESSPEATRKALKKALEYTLYLLNYHI